MFDILKKVSKIPCMANDFFRHYHKYYSLRVFLCGAKPEDLRFDIRMQLKNLIQSRFGCDAFLGEDIEALKGAIKIDRDHLTIEVQEAKKSDIIIMFLGSVGTISEVTAFALAEDTRSKTIVLNDEKFRKEKSFLSQGPLKILPREHIIYYDSQQAGLSLAIIKKIDELIAQKWFERRYRRYRLHGFNFYNYLTLAFILALYPVRYSELKDIAPLSEQNLRSALKPLFDKKVIREEEKKYLPNRSWNDMPLVPEQISDITRMRAELMSKRILDQDIVSDYRLIM